MIHSLTNPYRGSGLALDAPDAISSAATVARLLALCPAHAETPLRAAPALAARAGVAELWVKDERGRMGLGSFKALGAAFAIALEASEASETPGAKALAGRTYVTASAGNHGLSVAAGARIFGAEAVIYLSHTVPQPFAERLRGMGARVVRSGAHYEASMQAAAHAADTKGWTLLSDSSWAGYSRLPLRVMQGYLQLAAEAARQIPAPPSHILLQAGVGGLAGAVAAFARAEWGDTPEIIVIEPEAAPALMASIRAGVPVITEGPVSAMGRLDCKEPSLIALKSLSRDADRFVTLSEADAAAAMPLLAAEGLATTPSGGAGLAALLTGLDLPAGARVMAILSEGPEDG